MKHKTIQAEQRQGERGAALITALLLSVLVLTAGGTLLMTTALSTVTTLDATTEQQAYYTAEAGMQATLNVLRGNVAPTITFRMAVTPATSNLSGDSATVARLSRWLNYSYPSGNPDRVAVSSNYSPFTGFAFNTVITDPDRTETVTFSTSAAFSNGSSSITITPSGSSHVTLTYTPQPITTITAAGNSTLGTITLSNQLGTVALVDEPITITISQTAPFTETVQIACKLNGTITSTSSSYSITFAGTTNNLHGTKYVRAANPLNVNNTTPIATSVTAPDPLRLVINVTGYGPRGAKKHMQSLLFRTAVDFTPNSGIVIRSADDNTTASINIGSSSQYEYNGNDNAGGTALPAITVTSDADYSQLLSQYSSNPDQVLGDPPIQKMPLSAIAPYLQTADAARTTVNTLRATAKNELPSRYFTAVDPPTDFGAGTPNGKLTFCEGDCALGPAGGAGMLVVSGTLTVDGRASFNGTILVLGAGVMVRSGGGNGDIFGSIAVARFDSSGGFMAPTFNTSGAGNSSAQYDSDWVRRALSSTGPLVMGVTER